MYHFLHHIVYLTSTLLICLLVALSSQMILFTAFANGRKMGKIPSVCCIDPPILHLNARLGGEALLSLSPRPITHLPQPKRPFSPISGGVSWCMFRHIHPLIQGFWDLSPPHAPHNPTCLHYYQASHSCVTTVLYGLYYLKRKKPQRTIGCTSFPVKLCPIHDCRRPWLSA